MRVAELWRYPVKSLRGERLEQADVTLQGLAGDRLVQVARPDRGLVTARTHPRLLLHQGTFAGGETLVDGHPWRSDEAATALQAAVPDGFLTDAAGRFDVLPLSVATDGAIAAAGLDGRRFRPNIVIGGVEGLAERGWPGGTLEIGAVVIGIWRLRPRCVMTTYDPDTVAQDHGVLRTLVGEFDGTFALDCEVLQPGVVRVGDPVRLRRAVRALAQG
jgi:MOSC domain-containing protein